MKFLVRNITLGLDEDESSLTKKISKEIRLVPSQYSWRVVKKSIDARKDRILFVYLLEVETMSFIKSRNVSFYEEPEPLVIPKSVLKDRPVVVGFGPAGIFSALLLARAGAKPIVLERGKPVEEREKDIEQLEKHGILNPNSNMCFGEGGAGTFSDGKLNTGVRDSRIEFVLQEFVKHGAKEDILTDALPHIGSDYLRKVVRSFREEIISLGGEVRFSSTFLSFKNKLGRVSEISYLDQEGNPCSIKTRNLVLALGHSARDTVESLYGQKVQMEPKDFSMGVRIEHLQKDINKSQYHSFYLNKKLPPSSYKSVIHLENGRTVYSFCMCPGGVVVNSSSAEKEVLTNGMSLQARSGENGNAALLVSVKVDDYFHGSPLDGFAFQKNLEEASYISRLPYFAPAEMVSDFLSGKEPMKFSKVKPTYKPGVYLKNLDLLLPKFISAALKEAMPILSSHQSFFSDPEAVMTGFETRSSSPVRIPRDDKCMSNVKGLYPTGEGASFAGGIMSSALDGIKVALSVLQNG